MLYPNSRQQGPSRYFFQLVAIGSKILLCSLFATACPAIADSNVEESEEAHKLWRPPFVGGVRGPLLGVGWNGFLELDGADYSDDRSGEFEDGFVVRRARLTFGRRLSDDWDFKGSAQINQNFVELKDIYGLYTGFDFGSVRIGSQKEPFSLQDLTSARFTTFMERALAVDALTPDRNIGVTLRSRRENLSAQVGLFTGGFTQDAIRTTGNAVTGRLAGHHSDDTGRIFHGGLSLSYRVLGSTPPQYRSRPESGVNNTFMIDTGELELAHDVFRFGLEAAYVKGPLSLQTEYIYTRVGREGGASALDFSGWYLHGSWFLTGELRTYQVGTGTFGRVFPNSPFSTKYGGWGAWELAARISQADLTDEEVIGGKETNLSVGLNWHLREYVVIMANYIKVLEMDRPGSEFDGNEMEIFQVRLQLEF